MPPKGKGRYRRLQKVEDEALLKEAKEYGGLIGGIIIIALGTGASRAVSMARSCR